jgi:hypothetical protein
MVLKSRPDAQPPVALGSPAAPSWLIYGPLYRRSVGNAVSGLLRAVYAATQKSPAQEVQHGASALGLGGKN